MSQCDRCGTKFEVWSVYYEHHKRCGVVPTKIVYKAERATKRTKKQIVLAMEAEFAKYEYWIG
jgi:hypothetical protein